MHSVDHANQQLFDVCDFRLEKGFSLSTNAVALQKCELCVDSREDLTDFIMEFTTDAFSFFFLYVENLNGLLLAPDDAFSLFNKTHTNGVGDAIGGGFIRIQHAVQQL